MLADTTAKEGGGVLGCKPGKGKALEDLMASPGPHSCGVSASLTGSQAHLQGQTLMLGLPGPGEPAGGHQQLHQDPELFL